MRKGQKYRSGKAYDSVKKKNGTALVVENWEKAVGGLLMRGTAQLSYVVCKNRRGQKRNERKETWKKSKARIRQQLLRTYSRYGVNLARACLGSWPR